MKIRLILLLILCFMVSPKPGAGQLSLKGQASAWLNGNPANDLKIWSGVRYLPQLNYQVPLKESRLFDLEASANLNTLIGTCPFDTLYGDIGIKHYRLWARYSDAQFEIRLGLQKINFGSASLIRPLMWFDQMDPRDPLQLTDGVWALLGRYYFLNNANLWLWILYGNGKPKTWEIGATSQEQPEFGGRIQWPVPQGEMAFSFHHRLSDTGNLGPLVRFHGQVPENRLGIDGKWDIGIGLWYEAVWFQKTQNIGVFTNQASFSLGADYTLGIGNGLNILAEHLLFSYDEKAFQFKDPYLFSMLSLNYPLGLNDRLGAILYYDWKNEGLYNLITWNHQFSWLELYVMGYSNPTDYKVPLTANEINLFAGTGIQCMIVFNH